MDGRELKRTLNVHERIARVMADDRFALATPRAPDVRMFAVATIWAAGHERAPEVWERVAEILHMRSWDDFWKYIRADAPRWEPPGDNRFPGGCVAPMVRRDGKCGQTGSRTVRVTDSADGTWHMASYCSRHREQYEAARREDYLLRSAGGIPEPVPNTGGLLPCYFTWSWPDQYARARPGWTPPSYGICADDWPVLAKVREMEPPKLRLLAGDGEAAGHGAPSLKLVRS